MLLEFRVKNFRSLRDEQVLSMVASKDKDLKDTHTQSTGVRAAPEVLRSAVIYGANASGKSNLIKALQYMQRVITESAATIKPDLAFAVHPFRLDENAVNQPSSFEITFLIGQVRYQYGFAITAERIVSEYLLVYKAFKPQRWFERRYDEEKKQDVYTFGAGLRGPKHLWESATRANALFLSMAVQLNSEDLKHVYDWLTNKLVIMNEHTALNLQFSIQQISRENKHQQIRDFIAAADISIAKIDVQSQKVAKQVMLYDANLGKTELRTQELDEYKLSFHHVTNHGQAVFDLMDESEGTRNLFFLAGPILDIVSNGFTLVIDGLDSSLHSLLVRELVNLFHQKQVAQKAAQLIFTTHNTSLLDASALFRRDQIWLVDKDQNQASSLLSLSEFSPRKNEALERGYLMGRYGGIPFIARGLNVGATH